MRYCCKQFEKYSHKLSIGMRLDGKYPFAWFAVYTFGSVDLVEDEYARINYCPFCGKKLESEEYDELAKEI